jgi:beta-lactamase class A
VAFKCSTIYPTTDSFTTEVIVLGFIAQFFIGGRSGVGQGYENWLYELSQSQRVLKGKEIAVLQHSQKTSRIGRQQLLQERRQAAQLQQVRQRRQDTQKARLIAKRQQKAVAEGRRRVGHPEALMVRGGVPSPKSSREKTMSTRVRAQSRVRTLNAGERRRRTSVGWVGARWAGYCLRLGSFGLGISAIVGTAIAILHPLPNPGKLASSMVAASQKIGLSDPTTTTSNASVLGLPSVATLPVLSPEKELKDAKAKIQNLAAAQADLVPGMFFYNPDTGAYLDLAGDKSFSAASTIKLPVLIALFQDIDAGKARLDDQLTMRKDLIATESGAMQYQPPGTKYSALETAENMITVSDNTATNMLIDRLGGAAALNQRFKTWGLTATVIHNLLPDLQGTNTISPKDLASLMFKISQGDLLTPHSRDRVLNILRRTVTDTLLPQGLGKGATIAHKTGDIGSVVGDAGLIEIPNGQRYVATVMVKRPHNDPRAQELIRQISRVTYQALSQPIPKASPAASATPPSEEKP